MWKILNIKTLLYFAFSIIFALLIAIYFLGAKNDKLENQLLEAHKNIESLNIALNAQNEAIAKLQIDTENYKKQIASERKAWQAKYNNIAGKIDKINATCEQQIANINEQLNAFKNINISENLSEQSK